MSTKCKSSDFCEIYKDMLDSNYENPVTADAAEVFRLKCVERGLSTTDTDQLNLLLKMLNRGCMLCHKDHPLIKHMFEDLLPPNETIPKPYPWFPDDMPTPGGE